MTLVQAKRISTKSHGEAHLVDWNNHRLQHVNSLAKVVWRDEASYLGGDKSCGHMTSLPLVY